MVKCVRGAGVLLVRCFGGRLGGVTVECFIAKVRTSLQPGKDSTIRRTPEGCRITKGIVCWLLLLECTGSRELLRIET